MADYTIAPGQTGAYEIGLTANTAIVVAIPTGVSPTVSVLVGTAPVYARSGQTVTVRDASSTNIPPLTWATVPAASSGSIALISAAAATVSVYFE